MPQERVLSKVKIGSEVPATSVLQFFFMLLQSPGYCQSFECFFVSVSYFGEEESLNKDTEFFFLPTY